MAKPTGADLEHAHNQGQSDGTRNDYKPPVPISPLDEIAWPEETLKEWRELNEAYDKGWNNGYKTR